MHFISSLVLVLAVGTSPLPNTEVIDLTAVTSEPLLNAFADEELAGAGPVAIVWASSVPVVSAMVPYQPSRFPECEGVQRCIIVSQEWWAMTNIWYGIHAVDARRVLIAHEFGHVLSLERKETDLAYAKAVNRIDEECLADAVATYVLARGSWPPSVTENYNVAYQCRDYWLTQYGEDRGAEALALAEDLLRWAVYRWEPVPEPEPVPAPPNPGGLAVATEGAVRVVAS